MNLESKLMKKFWKIPALVSSDSSFLKSLTRQGTDWGNGFNFFAQSTNFLHVSSTLLRLAFFVGRAVQPRIFTHPCGSCPSLPRRTPKSKDVLLRPVGAGDSCSATDQLSRVATGQHSNDPSRSRTSRDGSNPKAWLESVKLSHIFQSLALRLSEKKIVRYWQQPTCNWFESPKFGLAHLSSICCVELLSNQ